MDGADFGGVKQQDDDERAEAPPHWLPCFTVSDTEATVTRALSAGGEPLASPTHIPGGPWVATLLDPRGGPRFGVHTP